MARPFRVAFLWHMHQPEYRDLGTGVPLLPWVRLHALHDYADFPAILAERPGARQTINLTPVLLDQLEAAAGGGAPDPWLRIARVPAEEWDPAERAFAVENFFSVSWDREIHPVPRYRELLARRGITVEEAHHAAPSFPPGDLRDLMVWFHLAWSGNLLRSDPLVAELRRKGRGFTEEEKAALLDLQQEFLKGVVVRYGALPNVELTTTPDTHPILPLLIDTDAARACMPGAPLPRRFQAPDRALGHVRRAIASHERRFGRRPAGMWPAEGSVSDAVLQMLGEEGIAWCATDRSVLEASLGGAAAPWAHLFPWRVGGRERPAVFFRDTGLSDLIGFTYASSKPQDAAADFVQRLQGLAEVAGDKVRNPVIPVILDGENAWEHYEAHGRPFLLELLGRLEADPMIQTVTFSEALQDGAAHGEVESLRPGSWIGADFRCWIGHPEKNRAWRLLSETPSCPAGEGSDWFWWFGDDHPTPHAHVFDSIFRTHLRNAWRDQGLPPPEILDEPIRRMEVAPDLAPSGPLDPVLDGRLTDYLEWLPAGTVMLSPGTSTIGTAAQPFDRLRYGFSRGRLHLLFQSATRSLDVILVDSPLSIECDLGRVTIRRDPGDPPGRLRTEGFAVEAAAGSVLEVSLPAPTSLRLRIRVGSLPEIPVTLRPPAGEEDWIV